MVWFFRKKKHITTPTEERKNLPKGLWYKTNCGCTLDTEELKKNFYICPNHQHHIRIGSREYFEILFDENKFKEMDKKLSSKDPLKWKDNKKYTDRIKQTRQKEGLYDAIRTAQGKIEGAEVIISCMDFSFIAGSMGSVVGEKIARAINVCIQKKIPFVLISKSGGARMMEAPFSLMQMAKTVAKLTQLSSLAIPFISVLTDPTTGGVTASFALLGDANIAEPGALIGFAGPRVIKELIGKDLPEGFQKSEFLLEKGFIDVISARSELKKNIASILSMMKNNK